MVEEVGLSRCRFTQTCSLFKLYECAAVWRITGLNVFLFVRRCEVRRRKASGKGKSAVLDCVEAIAESMFPESIPVVKSDLTRRYLTAFIGSRCLRKKLRIADLQVVPILYRHSRASNLLETAV
jgi:hypothetical protein